MRLVLIKTHFSLKETSTFTDHYFSIQLKYYVTYWGGQILRWVDKLQLRMYGNHIQVYSRRLINFCIKHQAGTLLLLNQEDKIGIAKEEELVLRNWSC